MSRLVWGVKSPLIDQGVDRGVLYLQNHGVAWNGLVSVSESDASTVDVDHYYDGNRLWASQETGEFQASVEAYTYPAEFSEYNGYSERERYQRFGFSYRTLYGDGYKLHIVYSVLVNDTDRAWSTISQTSDPSLFKWDISAAAVPIPGARPAARLTIEVGPNADVLKSIEDILYGTATTNPRLPAPSELYSLYEAATLLRITYNGDGSYTATGPDSMVRDIGDGTFELNAPSVFLQDQDIFTVSSY